MVQTRLSPNYKCSSLLECENGSPKTFVCMDVISAIWRENLTFYNDTFVPPNKNIVQVVQVHLVVVNVGTI